VGVVIFAERLASRKVDRMEAVPFVNRAMEKRAEAAEDVALEVLGGTPEANFVPHHAR